MIIWIRLFKAILLGLIFISCVKTPGFFTTEPVPINSTFSEPVIDSLLQVKGEIKSPYDYVCRFNVNRRIGFIFGTNKVSSGALLSDGILITAGHNFYSPWYNQAKGVRIQCGIGSKSDQNPVYEELNLSIDDQIYVSNKFNWNVFSEDISFVRVCNSDSITPNESPFRIASIDEIDSLKPGIEIYVSGYPAEKPYTGSLLMHLKTKIQDLDNDLISYTFTNTYGGMSGSPIWYENDGELIIIGVHVSSGGKGYKLDARVLDDFNKWERSTEKCK